MKLRVLYLSFLMLMACGSDREQPLLSDSDIEVVTVAKRISMLEKAYDKDPDNTDVLYRLATIHFEADALTRARELCARLLKVDPDHEDGQLLQARIDLRQGRWEQGLAIAEALFSQGYQNPLLNEVLSEIYAEKQDYLKALDQASMAIDKNPARKELYYQRGRYYLWLNDTVNASRNFRQAFEAGYASVDFLNDYTRLLIAENQTDEATLMIKNALELKPDDPGLQFSYASLLDKQGETGKAKKVLLGILDNHADDLEVLTFLGELYFRQNRYDSALYFTDRMQVIDEAYIPGYHIAARVYRRIGRYYSALDTYRKILEIDPRDPIALVEQDKLENYLAYLQKVEEEYENRPQVPVLKSKSIDDQ